MSSHLVKYSHHPDGRAHFSQDGRVRTEIKKQSVPLDNVEGHLFSLHVQGLHGFEAAQESDKAVAPSRKRTVVRFMLEDPLPGSIKFVGRLHSSGWLQARAVNGMVSPTMQLVQPDGTTRHAFVWSSPLGTPGQERCLVLSIEPLPRLDQARSTSLVFVAGFDARERTDAKDGVVCHEGRPCRAPAVGARSVRLDKMSSQNGCTVDCLTRQWSRQSARLGFVTCDGDSRAACGSSPGR